jgi:opacity protein-like surface antigen
MFRYPAFAMLLTLGVLGSGSAFAMDVPPPVDVPETTIGGVGQGWYMRGDLGYSGWLGDEEPRYNVLSNSGSISSVETFDQSRFDDNAGVALGVGYQFNDMIRADATVDYFSSSLEGRSDIGTPCAGQPAGTRCGFQHAADFHAIGVMGNVYADLGTIAGFTPYVGGGAGVTNVDWEAVQATPYCIDGTGSCAAGSHSRTSYEGMDSLRFSYALMAGVSYDISSWMKLDVGYRFSQVRGGDMFEYSAAEKAQGGSGPKGSDDGLSRHEFRAGFRFNTW